MSTNSNITPNVLIHSIMFGKYVVVLLIRSDKYALELVLKRCNFVWNKRKTWGGSRI